MKKFDPQFFRKHIYEMEQIDQLIENAQRDLKIAHEDKFTEVRFTYTYQAFIKGGLALIASVGGVKVRSVPGHHVKIIQKMAEILNNQDIEVIGNSMRMKRNLDLYEGKTSITELDANDYLTFVENTLKLIKQKIIK